MRATDGNGHPPHSYRKRITAEWALVKRLHRNALVEPEVLEADRFAGVQSRPVDALDARAATDLELIQG